MSLYLSLVCLRLTKESNIPEILVAHVSEYHQKDKIPERSFVILYQDKTTMILTFFMFIFDATARWLTMLKVFKL